MKPFRLLLALPGLAALAWGAVLIYEFAFPLWPGTFVAAGWLLGFPILHDALIAPLVGVVAFVLSRVLPKTWKAPVMVGAVLTGVLAIVAFPLLWRTYGAPPPPGPHDNPELGLVISLAVVWIGVTISGLVRHLRTDRARARAGLGRPERPSV
ncbi:hypothetical protein SAMN05421504_103990 [Amycolatopsis xylanica]|uniref:Uncharacterized protein n=1 Tax=Amycolatopsis xylanica TaxID=589385 RepID=A0A1H3EV47_9PSEU|nr:hypothetical protein [Amycolatopsis xylanica]SDX82490.1 hypothetical protein SAMN05421504_103990 [Amycolatopsis xylanica]